jgi:glucan phosphoethanolaminetransferase (alkaline phosphatase superfamily)
MAGVTNMGQPQIERSFPDYLYVPIHEVVTRASIVVMLLCVLSLITSLVTKFNLIHPLFALLFAVAAAGFYLMGKMFEILRKRLPDLARSR